MNKCCQANQTSLAKHKKQKRQNTLSNKLKIENNILNNKICNKKYKQINSIKTKMKSPNNIQWERRTIVKFIIK